MLGQLFFRISCGLICFFFVAGCTTAQNSIFRSFDLDDGASVATGASQRIIINTKTHPSSRPGRVNPERIVCAEPSPDVASIVANSFGFGVNVLGKGNAALSAGQSSALAQLAERTVTVQLLRDQMYRACEAYANGAISGTEYSLLMSRNNDAMVTLMLGETASRTVGRQLAALGASSDSDVTARMQDLKAKIEEALQSDEEADDAAEDAANAQETEAAAESALQQTDAGTGEAATDSLETDAEEAQSESKDKEGAAKDARKAADEDKEKLLEALAKTDSEFELKSGGFTGSPPQLTAEAVKIAEQLTEMHEQFLDQGAEEHFISACVVELGRTSKLYTDYNNHGDWAYNTQTQEWEWTIPPYRADQDISFTKRDYDPVQYALMDILNKRFHLNDEPGNNYSNHNALTPIELRALNWAYENLSDPAVAAINLPSEATLSNRHEDKIQRTVTLFVQTVVTDFRLLAELADQGTVETLGEELRKAFKDESRGLSDLFIDESDKTDRLLRATMAIEDRERASFLAKACLAQFSNEKFWVREDNARRAREFFDYIEDVETIRNSKPKPATAARNADKPNPPKAPNVAKMYQDYVNCDNEHSASQSAAVEACRIGVIGKYYGTPTTPDASGRGSAEGAFVVRLSRYDSQTGAESGWAVIKSKMGDALKGKAPDVKKVKEENKDYYALRAKPFASEKEAQKFCTDNKAKLKSEAKVDCIPKKR